MTAKPARGANNEKAEESEPVHIRLPGLITEDEVGLGTLLKRVTSAAGIAPCDDCETRAAALDRLIVFTRRNQ